MISYILRNTIYKKSTRESQDMLIKTHGTMHVMYFLCNVLIPYLPIIFIFAYTGTIEICEGIKLSGHTSVWCLTTLFLYVAVTLLGLKFFPDAMFATPNAFFREMYFRNCTIGGGR